MNPLISVVIPVYNVSHYLPMCMESVLRQTYDNYEVILVDDGSNDGSGELCDEYAESNSNVLSFHKENGGLSDARNFGVKKANGTLISFVDSDDYVGTDYLEHLYKLMDFHDADIVTGSFEAFSDEPVFSAQIGKDNGFELSIDDALSRICYTSVAAYPRLYSKAVLLSHPYPVGRIYEDLATSCKLIGSSKKAVFSDRIIYYYRIRSGSLCHGTIDQRQYDIFWAAKEQLDYIFQNYPDAKDAAEYRYVGSIISFLNNLFMYKAENKREHFQRARDLALPYMKPVIHSYKTSGYASNMKELVLKASCAAIYLGYYPSKVFWNLKFFGKKIRGWIRDLKHYKTRRRGA